MSVIFGRHGVVTGLSPRMAAQYASDAQETAVKQAVHFQCFHKIMRAGGFKPATGGRKRGDGRLVKTDQQQKWRNGNFLEHGIS